MSDKKKTIIITAAITFFYTSVLYALVIFPIINRPAILSRMYGKPYVVMDTINKEYAGEIDKQKMEDYAAKGVVAALDDPHSMYLTEEEFGALYSEISGNYTGIGIEVFTNDSNELEIATVFPDTPAYDAGMLRGDIFKSVDSLEVTPDSFEDVILYMRGISEESKNSDTMKITVIRDGEELQFDVVRSDITVQTVTANEFDNVYYIRISGFTDNTEQDFKSAVDGIDLEKYIGMIIDLRDNPGGYLTTVVNIADYLLPKGTIVYTSDKNGKKQYFNSDSEEVDIPIVVLTNGDSASASEILAAALHDNKKATLIGEKTYGKGSVQEMIQFDDNSVLKLTTAHYYTPAGVCIDGIGIEPDIPVSLPEELKSKSISLLSPEEDTQLQKAIEVLNQ